MFILRICLIKTCTILRIFNFYNKIKVLIIVISLFILRTIFGLYYDFWFEDNIQIYLIGLKFYTSSQWQFWGPDVVSTGTYVPGALQSILTGLPFYLFSISEIPSIFLNLLSIVVLYFFAWYLSKRLINIPFHIILLWLFTLPSTMYYTTNIQNPSYVLIGSIPFFISVFELFPIYKNKLIHNKICYFFLGFSLLWIFQLHFSWVLLLPFILLCFYFEIKTNNYKNIFYNLFYFIIGLITSGIFVLPTFIFETQLIQKNISENINFNIEILNNLIPLIINFFSLSTYEIEKLIPSGLIKENKLVTILINNFWLIPLVVFFFTLRIAQFIFILYSIWKNQKNEIWRKINLIVYFTCLILIVSFSFSKHYPNTHKFYVLMPISAWLGLNAFDKIYHKKQIKTFTSLTLIFIIILYIFLIPVYFSLDISIYSKKNTLTKALKNKDYTFAGVRREFKNHSKIINWISNEIGNINFHYTNFDYFDSNFSPQNIVSTKSFSGKYSCKIDSIQPFGCDFIKSFQHPTKINKIKINFNYYTDSSLLSKAGIVITLKNQKNNKNIWHFIKIDKNKIQHPNSWDKINIEFRDDFLNNIDQNDIIEIYFWIPDKTNEVIYIDNMSICFFKQNSL